MNTIFIRMNEETIKLNGKLLDDAHNVLRTAYGREATVEEVDEYLLESYKTSKPFLDQLAPYLADSIQQLVNNGPVLKYLGIGKVGGYYVTGVKTLHKTRQPDVYMLMTPNVDNTGFDYFVSDPYHVPRSLTVDTA